MIIGGCPYCDESFMIPIAPDPLPKFQDFICEKCGRHSWLKHSRIDPCSYKTDDIEVNEETKTVRLINGQT